MKIEDTGTWGINRQKKGQQDSTGSNERVEFSRSEDKRKQQSARQYKREGFHPVALLLLVEIPYPTKKNEAYPIRMLPNDDNDLLSGLFYFGHCVVNPRHQQ